MIAVANIAKFTKVDPTTPMETFVSATGTTIAAGSNIPVPDVVKAHGTDHLAVASIAAIMDATAATLTAGTWQPSAAWTKRGEFASSSSPASGQRLMSRASETTPAAAGTLTGINYPLAGGGKSVLSYVATSFVLKPDLAASAPKQPTYTNSGTGQSNSGSLTVAVSGLAVSSTAPQTLVMAFLIDDATAVVAAPTGAVLRQTTSFAGGKLLQYTKLVDAADVTAGSVTFAFGPAGGSVPTVTTAAVVSAAHSPAKVGDTVNVDSSTVYSTPTSAIDNYERRVVFSSDGGATFTDPASGTAPGGTAAAQASLPVYTILSADAGLKVEYASRAHNDTGWSAWSYSNALTVESLPANTVAPTLAPTSGATIVGNQLTATTGTWTFTPTSYAYQFERAADGTVVRAKSSVATFTPTAPDDYRVRVWATNGVGESVAGAVSGSVTVVAAFNAVTDVAIRHSGGSGNTQGGLDLGGAAGGVLTGSLSALFSSIAGTVAAAGTVEYRGVYFENTHLYTNWLDLVTYIKTQFPGGSDLTLAVGVPVDATVVLPTITDQFTAPSGVTFVTGTDPANAPAIGSLLKNTTGRLGLWLRLTVTAGAPQAPSGVLAQFAIGAP